MKSQLIKAFPGLEIELRHVVTQGDRTQGSTAPIPSIGGKGLFTAELEELLLSKEIDFAVHSLKDLPTEVSTEFTIAAVPERGNVWDAFLTREKGSFNDLKKGAVVGTSSVRRSSQILRLRPDLKIQIIRGNVDTRIQKLRDPNGPYDAIVIAAAGLERLSKQSEIESLFGPDEMLPAPGQGALGIECRSDDEELHRILERIHHAPSAIATATEREFLKRLGGGCNTPVSAFAEINGETLSFRGRCLSPDGSRSIEVNGQTDLKEYEGFAVSMANEALSRGFADLISTTCVQSSS